MDKDLAPSLEALAQEQLSDQETRNLLERLSLQEFADPSPTVGALSEVSGASPLVIGRMLAEIRQQNLQELFGQVLARHGSALVHLEDRVEEHDEAIIAQAVAIQQLKSKQQASPRPSGTTYVIRTTDGYEVRSTPKSQEERNAEFQRNLVLVLLFFGVPAAVMVWMALAAKSRFDEFASPTQTETPVWAR